MDSIRYVVRFFSDNNYIYSVHCGPDILDDIVSSAKDEGFAVKILAYKEDSESEV